MKTQKIRKDFPVFRENPQLVYLDNAATAQKPEQVINRLNRFYKQENANVGRGLYKLAEKATREYGKARKNISDFIGAEEDEIIFLRNTTEAENLLASSLEFEGNIVVSEMSHHSEQLPWRRKAKEEDRKIRYLETEDGKISVESAKQKIDESTGIVAISHISNVFGTENPVEEIVDIAHENNAFVVLDAAQSTPHTELDVKNLDVDFLCFSGHKMLGPTGIGVLYSKKKLLRETDPYQVGGGMISSVKKNSIEYTDAPEKFEAGTPHIAGAIGLSAAVDYLEDIGMRNIERHSRKIADKAKNELEQIEGVNILSPEDPIIVSFTTDFAHPHDVAEILSRKKVAVRAGHHCAQPQMEKLGINGTVRASPYIYNTEEDVENLTKAIKQVKEVFK